MFLGAFSIQSHERKYSPISGSNSSDTRKIDNCGTAWRRTYPSSKIFESISNHPPSTFSPVIISFQEFLEQVNAVTEHFEPMLDAARADKAEREMTQILRNEQDEAYEQSLLQDKVKVTTVTWKTDSTMLETTVMLDKQLIYRWPTRFIVGYCIIIIVIMACYGSAVWLTRMV